MNRTNVRYDESLFLRTSKRSKRSRTHHSAAKIVVKSMRYTRTFNVSLAKRVQYVSIIR